MANPNPSPATRFQAGNCASPRGRPKGRSITERLRSLLEKGEFGGKPLADGRTDLTDRVLSPPAAVADGIQWHLFAKRSEPRVRPESI